MLFTYSEKTDKKDKHSYIEVTGYEGSIRDLVIPDAIDGMRVEAIGNHAFSGRQDLCTVILPEGVRTILGFAFHNCRNLKRIELYDSVDDYYDGVIRQCDSLEEVAISIKRGWYEVVRNFLADNDKRIRIRLNIAAADETALLTFPEYVYDFNENTMARTIQFSIAGSGMFYRECVDRRCINYREYDRLFEKAMIDGGEVAQDIALGRLLYPCELDEIYRTKYEDYVKANAEAILARLIPRADKDREVKEILKSLNNGMLSSEQINYGIKLSSELGLTEVSAILMEYGRPDRSSEDSEFVF
ncbi:MAG: leucine-rich repeat domain-containing protein [Butyrivibrio sp.]|nr:leucine-rich repeat domain-containing protein [Butyrivibrio sp.]